MTQSQCLMMIGTDGGLSPLRYSCQFSCQMKMLKTCPGPGKVQMQRYSA